MLSGEKPSVSVNIAFAQSAAQSLVSTGDSHATMAANYNAGATSLPSLSLLTTALQTPSQIQKAQNTSRPLIIPTSLSSAIQALTRG